MTVQNDSLINTNVTQRRRKQKKTQKETIALNVIKSTITKSRNSIDKDIVSEIKDKNSRQINPKHAQTT